MSNEGGVDGVEGYEDSGSGGEEGRVTWIISFSVLNIFRPEVLQVGHSSWVVGWDGFRLGGRNDGKAEGEWSLV